MRLQVIIRHTPVLDRHVVRQKVCTVSFGEVRSQDKIGWQKAPRFRIPVYSAAAHTVRRHKGTPFPDGKCGLVYLVAKGERAVLGPQKKLVANMITQFVLRIIGWKIGGCIAPRTAFDGDDIQPFVRELVRKNRACPAETDNDYIFSRQLARHASTYRSPLDAARQSNGRQWKALVVAVDPIEIIVAGARKADHLPRHQITVAPVERIGKETGLNVFKHKLEERLAVRPFERDITRL